LTISQVHDNMGLANMPDPRYLDLTVSQVHNNVGLANILDLRHSDLAVRKVQWNDHASLAHPRE
jgi:hypothetical protein